MVLSSGISVLLEGGTKYGAFVEGERGVDN